MDSPDAQNRISFIGGGNMARALIGGMIAANHDPALITVADPDATQRKTLAKDLGVGVVADNAGAVADQRVVVLAVKPQVIDKILGDIGQALNSRTLVISVAAGTTLARLEQGLGQSRPLVRAMPNTPALYGAGMTGLVANQACNTEDRHLAEALFGAAGATAWVDDEVLMDTVTAVSGSGPAYFFALTEHLTKAGVSAGLPPALAAQFARQTAIGAGVMLDRATVDAGELRRRVTSPGGTTAAALEQFSADGFETMVERAVAAAAQRGRALGGK